MDEREPITRLTTFFEAFPDERSCEDYLFTLQFPNGFICSRCGCRDYGRIRNRRELQCHDCGRQGSLTAGSIMHRSHLPLRKWFLAIFLITHDKRGYSAMQLAHELKVTRKTAGYLLQRIRGAMALQVIPNVMSGIIELDDAYIGSKGKTRGRGTERVSFIVAVEKSKGGGVALRATWSLKGEDYGLFAHDHLSRTSHIRTDGFRPIAAGLASYSGLDALVFDEGDAERSLPCVHHIISNFKLVINGTYHGVRKDYLQSYMDEFSYRYNNRRNADVFHTLLSDVCFAIKRTKPVLIELFKFQCVDYQKVAA